MVDGFKQDIIQYIDAKHDVVLSSVKAAIHLALKVLSIKQVDIYFVNFKVFCYCESYYL